MINKRKLELFKDNFYLVERYLNIIKSQFETATDEEAMELLNNIVFAVFVGNPKVTVQNTENWPEDMNYTRSDFLRLLTIEKLQSNHSVFFNLLDQKREAVTEKGIIQSYSTNFYKNAEALINDYLVNLGISDEIVEKIRKGEFNNRYERVQLEKNFYNMITLFYKGDFKRVKQAYVRTTNQIAKFLHDYGTLEKYINTYNTRMKNLGADFLKQDKEEVIKFLTEPEQLEQLPLGHKIAILTFLTNRFAKEFQDIFRTEYIIRKCGGIYNAKAKNDEELADMMNEYDIVFSNIMNKIRNLKPSADELKTEQVLNEKFVELNEANYISLEKAKQLFPEKDAEESVKFITHMAAKLVNIYDKKDWAGEILVILGLKKDKSLKIKNWGYIPEYTNSLENSIQNNNKYILLGFDLPSLNDTIRLHYNLDAIRDIAKSYFNIEEIPVYAGDNDRNVFINGDYKSLTTPLVVPLTKDQKIKLKDFVEKLSDENPNKKYFEHLNCIINGTKANIPEHLQEQFGKHVDLSNGEISDKNEKSR